jgi:REP element-mobilizing transposase RayT
MRFPQPRTKWCHVTLSTYRRREVFKIAVTAKFCERFVKEACASRKWRLEAIVVRPTTIQVLVEVPRRETRRSVVAQLKAAAAAAVYRDQACNVARRVFETGHWYAVLRSSAAAAALRRHIQHPQPDGRASRPATTEPH